MVFSGLEPCFCDDGMVKIVVDVVCCMEFVSKENKKFRGRKPHRPQQRDPDFTSAFPAVFLDIELLPASHQHVRHRPKPYHDTLVDMVAPIHRAGQLLRDRAAILREL
jgi:hypothetical protein